MLSETQPLINKITEIREEIKVANIKEWGTKIISFLLQALLGKWLINYILDNFEIYFDETILKIEPINYLTMCAILVVSRAILKAPETKPSKTVLKLKNELEDLQQKLTTLNNEA